MSATTAGAGQTVVAVEKLSHRYGAHEALTGLSFSAARGEIFGLLGPNGGGKTTTFRVLSTLLPLQSGTVRIAGLDLARERDAIRRKIGVVFQAPSLDKKLTAFENLQHQGHLYGLGGAALKARIFALLERVRLADRAHEYVERFSGGMRRRVELAKGMLHGPEILILDEPSTGLDPGARLDLWQYLQQLSREEGVTSLVTTHYMEEAARCDRLAILHRGSCVALGTPEQLRAEIGGEVVSVTAREPDALAEQIRARFGVEVRVFDGALRIEHGAGPELLAKLPAAFGAQIESITLAKPTLDDVFIRKTGHRFFAEDAPAANGKAAQEARR